MKQEEMTEEVTRWSKVADSVLKAHVDTEQKIHDAGGFRMALVNALAEAYEQGLEDSLTTKATGPDA
jgi:hypothetical protein